MIEYHNVDEHPTTYGKPLCWRRPACVSVSVLGLIVIGYTFISLRNTTPGNIVHASPAHVKDVVSLSKHGLEADKTWKCTDRGMCGIRPPLDHWEDKSDYKHLNETVISGNDCKTKCLRDKKCTGVARSEGKTPRFQYHCVLWFGGACNIDHNNGNVWRDWYHARTCQLRSVALVEGFWKPVNGVIGEQTITLSEGRESSSEVSVSATQETTIGAETPAVSGAVMSHEVSLSMSQTFSHAWAKSQSEKWSITVTAKGKNQYLWQWVFEVTSRADDFSLQTSTREYAMTPSKLSPPLCLPGTAVPGTGYQHCVAKAGEIERHVHSK
mmetsp:Transcript_115309/g.229795  ORF Transcript_115309/g.229795 Transcript_115309/m.229795 type:complete len:325 (-) Transcript_115309:116-1090(-)